jgi:hypothetical protein
MTMPQDRTLSIRCTFNGFYRPSDGGYGGTMSYAIIGSTPDLGDIVAPTGQIEVDDKSEDKNYYFKPGIVVPALNNYYISVDPPLVNRGGTNR